MGDFTPLWALGLMSGTSFDGVDAALVRTDGETVAAFGPTHGRAYTAGERAVLRQAIADAATITARDARPGALADADRIVTEVHGEAVRALLARAAEEGIRPDVVGFHGQTVFHAPERGLTVQIGDARALAAAAGLPVVHDFRAADVAAGGQGAPLVPVFHRALAGKAGLPLPAAIVNVGGVANVTLVEADGDLLAFDTGPGNALIDDAVNRETGAAFDAGGAIAATGRVDETALRVLLDHPYFTRRPPKSLDRNAFHGRRLAVLDDLAFPDRVATLTAFTAATIAAALDVAAAPPRSLVVAGGGARNATLLRMLAERAGVAPVTADSIGLSGDYVEAQAFGYLAVRRLRGLPSTWSGTTGVGEPVVCGAVVGG